MHRSLSRLVGGSASILLAACASSGGGADAIVGDIPQATLFGQSGGIAAYSFGNATCNVGDAAVTFEPSSNQHPVWAQNLYRLQDGVFQQIGMSHLLHGFFALEQSLCATCSPVGLGDLGPGCSDVNSASIAGQQAGLGPRWQVNAFTGEFAFPFTSPPAAPTIGRRLQALVEDVDPALNAGATYWAEVHVVSPDDATAGNGRNNISSRPVAFGPTLMPSFVSPADREVAALEAWAMLDDEVLVSPIHTNEGEHFTVASRAYDNGDGTWLYVYALHNINSDRGARAFQFDIGSGTVTGTGFHSPFYHSGDGVGGTTIPHTSWEFSFLDEKVRWESETFDENANANALRWGTVYSFWFTSTREPRSFDADITLFKPTSNDPDASDTYNASVIKPKSCLADFDGGGTVNFGDINQTLALFGQSGEGLLADANQDGMVDFADLNIVLAEFGRTDCD